MVLEMLEGLVCFGAGALVAISIDRAWGCRKEKKTPEREEVEEKMRKTTAVLQQREKDVLLSPD